MLPDYYEFICPVKILSGLKALSNLPYELTLLGVKRPLIVTDQGVVKAGLLKLVTEAFSESKIKPGAIFDETPPDSGSAVVNKVAKLFKDKKCDSFVAVGGGSVIDTAKCANMIVVEGTSDLMKFQGVDRLEKDMKPFVVIPTTAGTGSEVTSAAVIYDEKTAHENGLYLEQALPQGGHPRPAYDDDHAAQDLRGHRNGRPHARGRGLLLPGKEPGVGRLCDRRHQAHFCQPAHHGERTEKQGGTAGDAQRLVACREPFSNSLVGVVHGIAHATGGVARVPHGVANSILLPYGMENNFKRVGPVIGELAPFMGMPCDGKPEEGRRERGGGRQEAG